ncbi:AI-2E family transporter [Actinoplanes sp. CA-051413]|uniref:AI-2E family transporter n=1 Tax=Actinoplanes sp. CA-051413 TaxID=3239899 RepID=UPI003D9704CC
MTTTDPTTHLVPADAGQVAAAPAPALHAGIPRWVIRSGMTGWLLLGLAGLAAVIILLLAYANRLVTPFLAAIVLAIVFSPVVDALQRRHVPRIVGATAVLLGLLGCTVGLVWAIGAALVDQAPEIAAQFKAALVDVAGRLTSLGLSTRTATQATSAAQDAGTSTTSLLLGGVFSGLRGLSSLLFGLFIGSVIFLFMLLNGRRYADWAAGRSGLAPSVVDPVMSDFGSAIRGYFRGTTIIAASNAVPVAIAAWALNVPLIGTIALITFITAYVPFFGAIIAGVFCCLIALGAQGLPAALILLAVLLFVNNVLQNFFAPVAYGSSLNLDPLVVLLVTTAAGLVGGVGLIVLAAPLTAVISRTTRRLAAARQLHQDRAGGPSPA